MQINEGKIKYDVRLKEYTVKKRRRPGSNVELRQTIPDLPVDQVYPYISYCAPYLEVIEEMTFAEFLEFHQRFKPFLEGMDIPGIISRVGLDAAAGKQIRYYSSGMRQRVKLAQAFFSDTPAIFLDEPCTNLDLAGINLYHQLIEDFGRNRLIVVSSNDEVEYGFCEDRININDYKLTS
jgi:ABC-type multidrug transport system ATPase subunit